MEEEIINSNTFLDAEGNRYVIASELEIRGRNFIIATNRKVFEKSADGTYHECTEKDDVTSFLAKCSRPSSKSLDIDTGEEIEQ